MKSMIPTRTGLALIVLMVLAVAAYAGGGQESGGGTATGSGPVSGKLEIFSWWTRGGEADALLALIDLYNKKYPQVEVINATVAGGAGFNAKAVLTTRMQGGDPPDTFQIHAGQELIGTWAGTGLLEPVNFIFEQNNWLSVYPKDIITILSSKDGKIWSVPPNVHRVNVLWYNKDVVERAGLGQPKSFDDFFSMAEKLKARGIIPLAHGDKEIWVSTTLFENVLLGALGADGYRGLFDGKIRWDSAQTRKAVELFLRVLDYANSDHAALNWDESADLMIAGKAASHIMGDWAEGYFKTKGFSPTDKLGWVPSMGSAGTFNAVSDSFCLPVKVKNRRAVIEWLKLIGSKEGQDVFNPIKGSIPPRTDCNVSLYDEYLQDSMKDYAADEIVPSITHGAAVAEPWAVAINEVVTMLVSNRDVNAALKSLQQAYEENQ
jgi:glucose/mannose transport system substrate-binding protein